jgi:uncharacterized membrane-anchored protein
VSETIKADLTKVPAVTLGFWIIKILATTFGETAGDTVSMSMNLGYLVGTAIFATILVILVALQIAAKRFHPIIYWATIVASTTAGTTMADFATRSLSIGYPGGSILLLATVLLSLAVWHRALGSISVDSVHESRAEIYYWLTITFSQTLGTALGDWIADGPLGYLGSAMVFGGLLALIALAYFWAAFILTRPLGAVVGDFLDKPVSHGGLELSRPGASLALGLVIVTLILVIPQRAANARVAHAGE